MALRNIINLQAPAQLPAQQLIMPVNISNVSSSSSGATGSSSSSIKIRTSSPITSETSESESSDRVISPSKFISAVHKSRKQQQQLMIQQQQVQVQPAPIKHYASIKELAYDKLRRQQEQEQTKPQNKINSAGKLKIAVSNNGSYLTLHIIEGRSYKSPCQLTYAKITMMPDADKRFSKCKTQTILPANSEKNRYYYNGKFSFEFDKLSDYNNRLVISVWATNERDCGPGDQMLGCFSFKIKHLMLKQQQQQSSQPETVWYHLLPQKYGLTKHLRCSTRRDDLRKNGQSKDIVTPLTNTNKDLIGLTKVQLCITKKTSNEDYGFTITGNCPCMVGKVDLDKTAFKHGLRPGDYISKINNTNVSRATWESVVKLIKSAINGRLNMEVYRDSNACLNSINNLANSIGSTSSASSTSTTSSVSSSSSLSYSDANYMFVNNYQYMPVINQQHQHQLQYQQPQIYMQQQLINNYGLEAVPEEDELDEDDEDLEINDDDQDDYELHQNYQYNQAVQMDNIAYEKIRYVDSSLTNDEDDQHLQTDAETLRRVAAQYYSTNTNTNSKNVVLSTCCRKANIASLRNLKINQNGEEQSDAHKFSMANLNQFI